MENRLCLGKSWNLANLDFLMEKSWDIRKNLKQYPLKVYRHLKTGPRRAIGYVSGNRCESDCRSRGRKFDPGPVPYFRGD